MFHLPNTFSNITGLICRRRNHGRKRNRFSQIFPLPTKTTQAASTRGDQLAGPKHTHDPRNGTRSTVFFSFFNFLSENAFETHLHQVKNNLHCFVLNVLQQMITEKIGNAVSRCPRSQKPRTSSVLLQVPRSPCALKRLKTKLQHHHDFHKKISSNAKNLCSFAILQKNVQGLRGGERHSCGTRTRY